MKKIIGAGVVAMSLLAGCSSSSDKLQKLGGDSRTASAVPAGGRAAPAVVPAANALTVDVRMRASGAEQYQSLSLFANNVRAFADGQEIQVQPTWNTVELANMSQAEKIATLAVPKDAKTIEFQVELGAAGGFATQEANGWVDTRREVLKYREPVSQLAKTNMSVIMVDASRSFPSKDADTRVFVPQFRIY